MVDRKRSGEGVETFLFLPATVMPLELQFQGLQRSPLVDRPGLASLELGPCLVEQAAQFVPMQTIEIFHAGQPVALMTECVWWPRRTKRCVRTLGSW